MTETPDLHRTLLGTTFLWCPACEALHAVSDSGWEIDTSGPLTVSPSILVTGGPLGVRCHSFLRDGVWEFLPDSTHALAGQQVPMVPLPDGAPRKGPR